MAVLRDQVRLPRLQEESKKNRKTAIDDRPSAQAVAKAFLHPVNPWPEVRACFETDDGSLPGIEITRLSPCGLAAVYAMLRARSRLDGEARFWCLETEAERPIDSVPDLALRIARGRASPFHIVVSDMKVGEVVLPELGVFVFQDLIELNYRMGREWGPTQVGGFFQLLKDCCNLEPAAELVPSIDSPPYPDRFMAAWESYQSDPT